MVPFSVGSFSLFFFSFLLVNLWASVLQIFCLLRMNQPYSWPELPGLWLQKHRRPLWEPSSKVSIRLPKQSWLWVPKVCTTFALTVHSVAGERSGCKVCYIYSFYFIINRDNETNIFTFFSVCVYLSVCVFSPLLDYWGETNQQIKTNQTNKKMRNINYILLNTSWEGSIPYRNKKIAISDINVLSLALRW